MGANETANRNSAGLIVQVFEDLGVPGTDYTPIILASWGFVDASLIRLLDEGVGEPGQYQIELEQAASGIVDASGDFFSRIDSAVVVQSLALPNFIGAIPFVDFLSFDPSSFVAGKPITLPMIAMQVTDDQGSAVDASGVLNVEVLRVPQQD